MNEVVLDPSAIAQIHDAKDYLRLCDARGRVLGYFLPADPATPQVIFGVKSPLTAEERQRRSQESGGKPLAEFWEDMRQKHPDKFQ